jgi:hypothetical protein
MSRQLAVVLAGAIPQFDQLKEPLDRTLSRQGRGVRDMAGCVASYNTVVTKPLSSPP